MGVATPNYNNKLNKSQNNLKITTAVSHINDVSKFTKITYQEIQKIRKSIRLMFYFDND